MKAEIEGNAQILSRKTDPYHEIVARYRDAASKLNNFGAQQSEQYDRLDAVHIEAFRKVMNTAPTTPAGLALALEIYAEELEHAEPDLDWLRRLINAARAME